MANKAAKPVPTVTIFKDKEKRVLNEADYPEWKKDGWRTQKDIDEEKAKKPSSTSK